MKEKKSVSLPARHDTHEKVDQLSCAVVFGEIEIETSVHLLDVRCIGMRIVLEKKLFQIEEGLLMGSLVTSDERKNHVLSSMFGDREERTTHSLPNLNQCFPVVFRFDSLAIVTDLIENGELNHECLLKNCF